MDYSLIAAMALMEMIKRRRDVQARSECKEPNEPLKPILWHRLGELYQGSSAPTQTRQKISCLPQADDVSGLAEA